jgi:hypothetical protein
MTKKPDKPIAQGPSAVLGLIIKDAQDFFDLVERLATASEYNATADYKDAYARFNRVWNRYDQQKSEVNPLEREALKKVMEEDAFIRKVLSIRVIADHRTHRTGAELPLANWGSVPLEAQTSAGSVFSNRHVSVPNPLFRDVYLHFDHLNTLREVERRLKATIKRATDDGR